MIIKYQIVPKGERKSKNVNKLLWPWMSLTNSDYWYWPLTLLYKFDNLFIDQLSDEMF